MVFRESEFSHLRFPFPPRCYLEDGASKGAWLNRSSIIFAGSDKWSVDPRVSIATANRREYSLQIQDVDVTDDGPYTCSVQTQHTPRTMQVHLTVQGTCLSYLQMVVGDILQKQHSSATNTKLKKWRQTEADSAVPIHSFCLIQTTASSWKYCLLLIRKVHLFARGGFLVRAGLQALRVEIILIVLFQGEQAFVLIVCVIVNALARGAKKIVGN